MKFWKLASASLALSLATSVNAVTISYGGYTHDTDTDIVAGNDLEWLQWDRTIGESINSIQSQLATLEGGGWRVASNIEMAQLFNAFDFGMTFVDLEHAEQRISTGYQYPDSLAETDELFIAMFGDTYDASIFEKSCYLDHCFSQAQAVFGSDSNNNGEFNMAQVRDDWQTGPGYYIQGEMVDGTVALQEDRRSAANFYYDAGIALVRDVSVVPVPAAAWLFGSGLIGLVGFARRKKA